MNEDLKHAWLLVGLMFIQTLLIVGAMLFNQLRFDVVPRDVLEEVKQLRVDVKQDLAERTADRIYRTEVLEAFRANDLKWPVGESK